MPNQKLSTYEMWLLQEQPKKRKKLKVPKVWLVLTDILLFIVLMAFVALVLIAALVF